MIITRVPVLLGQGIPLFGPLENDVKLRHVSTKEPSGGLVQDEYEVLPWWRRNSQSARPCPPTPPR